MATPADSDRDRESASVQNPEDCVDPNESDDVEDAEDLTLDEALARVTADSVVRAFEAAYARPDGPDDTELRDFVVRTVLGADADCEYGSAFAFDPLDLLKRVGGKLEALLAVSPHEYVTYGLTRVTLGAHAYLLSWYSGDDDSRDWVAAAWSPATARTPYLRALIEHFEGSGDRGYPLFGTLGDGGAIGCFACAGDLLDGLWRGRSRARWIGWLERWVGTHAGTARGLEVVLTETGDAILRTAGVGDLRTFAADLLERPDAIVGRFRSRTESREDRRLLVLLRRLDEGGELRLENPTLERAQAEWRSRGRAPKQSARIRAMYRGAVSVPEPRTDWIYVVTASFEKIWDRLPIQVPVRASHAYIGGAFVANRAVAEASGRPWFILSPQHGLVAPGTKVLPDALTFSAVERDPFIARTAAQAQALGVGGRPWHVLGLTKWRRCLGSTQAAAGQLSSTNGGRS